MTPVATYRLRLELPAAWRVEEGPGGSQRILPPGSYADVALSTQSIAPLPEDARRWQEQVLRWLVPDHAVVETIDARSDRTRTGWSLQVITARIREDANPIGEHRVYVLYSFLDHGCVAVVACATTEALERHGDEMLAVLKTGWPDWSSEIAAQHQLWEGIDWR